MLSILRHSVQGLHIVRIQLEIKDVNVLTDAFGRRGLWQDANAVLETPTEQDLRRGLPMPFCNGHNGGVSNQLSSSERGIALQKDIVFPAVINKFAIVTAWMELHLIHHRNNPERPFVQQLLHVSHGEVADSNGRHLAALVKIAKCAPTFIAQFAVLGTARFKGRDTRPMNKVKIGLFNSQILNGMAICLYCLFIALVSGACGIIREKEGQGLAPNRQTELRGDE